MSYWSYPPYVPVAKRREKALKKMEKLRKKGIDIHPINIEGRKIANTFWGQSWCEHLEGFNDYENRLPRGRTYVRNGSVCHLEIKKGEINAMVNGSELYKVNIKIKKLSSKKWADVKKCCSGKIGSLIDLLQGRLSDNVMEVVTEPSKGLFPVSGDISMGCSCPDWAVMCKHVSAVLYGVGARLDNKPELLFLLRGVVHEELITSDVDIMKTTGKGKKGGRKRIAKNALADVFGIEMNDDKSPKKTKATKKKKSSANKKIRKSKSTAPIKKIARKKPKQPKKAVAQHITVKTVKDCRKRLKMTPSQFARLLGVVTQTVNNWEGNRGRLTLRENSSSALRTAIKISRKKAWEQIQNTN